MKVSLRTCVKVDWDHWGLEPKRKKLVELSVRGCKLHTTTSLGGNQSILSSTILKRKGYYGHVLQLNWFGKGYYVYCMMYMALEYINGE